MTKRQYNDFNNAAENQDNNLNNKSRIVMDEEIDVTYIGELNQGAADFKAKKLEEGRVAGQSKNSIDLSLINPEKKHQITEKFAKQGGNSYISLAQQQKVALINHPKSNVKKSANLDLVTKGYNSNNPNRKALSKVSRSQALREEKKEQYKEDGLKKMKIYDNKVELNNVLFRELGNIKDIIINKFNNHSELNTLFLINMRLPQGSIKLLKDILMLTPSLRSLIMNNVKILDPSKEYQESFLIKNSHLNQLAMHHVKLSTLVTDGLINDIKNNKFITQLVIGKECIEQYTKPYKDMLEAIENNKILICKLAADFINAFVLHDNSLQTDLVGKLYFYQKSNQKLFKESIATLSTQIYEALLFNQTASEKHSYGDELDNSIEMLRQLHKKTLERQGLSADTIKHYLSNELELCKKESEQVEGWINNYILKNYNALRLICKTPDWIVNDSKGQEIYIPAYIMQHIFSFLGSCSLWSGNPMIKAEQEIANIEPMLFEQYGGVELTGEQLMEYSL